MGALGARGGQIITRAVRPRRGERAKVQQLPPAEVKRVRLDREVRQRQVLDAAFAIAKHEGLLLIDWDLIAREIETTCGVKTSRTTVRRAFAGKYDVYASLNDIRRLVIERAQEIGDRSVLDDARDLGLIA